MIKSKTPPEEGENAESLLKEEAVYIIVRVSLFDGYELIDLADNKKPSRGSCIPPY